MIYWECLPPQQLEPFVKCVWLLEVNGGRDLDDYILPDAYTELIVHYGLLGNTERVDEISEDTVFAGQIRSAFHLKLEKDIGMVGVRFKAEGASCFLNDSLCLTTDAIRPLEGWSPQIVSELENRVLAQHTRTGRIRQVWDFLGEKINTDKYDFQVAKIAKFIREKSGRLEISNLMDQINLGQRQVERRFKSAVGLSMKEYNRIIRFKEALNLLDNSAISFIDVALKAGYYDQAHFNREFKAFSGKSPKQFIKKSGDLSNLYNPGANVENLQYQGINVF